MPSSLMIGLLYALLLAVLYSIVGHIPVNEGRGWDGQVYLQYIELLGHGQAIVGDPYRSIRMSGFLPLIGASALGVPANSLSTAQAVLNIILISTSAGMLHDTLRQLGVAPRAALLSLATGLLAWPLLIMPFYYPVLSDNVALVVSCLCLWCWTRGLQFPLYTLLAYSVWVLPGLFLIPLALAAMPRNFDHSSATSFSPRLTLLLFAVSLPFVLSLVISLAGQLSDDEVASHSAHLGGQTALISLRTLSFMALVTSITVVVWLGARSVVDSSFWKSVRPTSALVAALVLAASAVAMYLLIDWTNGFQGPPLLHYMFMQSLAAPFKPLVAHFLSFGPVIIIAMAGCIAWGLGKYRYLPKALLASLVCFLPLMLVGSESRQWVGALPVAIVVAAIMPLSLLQRLCCLAFALLLALPSLWLTPALGRALGQGASFQSSDWQLYFGRNGPWMSIETYELGAFMLAAFCLTLTACWAQAQRRSRVLEDSERT
ncbi:hypothetical protein [Pseudomonas sp. FW305-96]|nr:hypothetical protein [Pseudomonas sp. FW305-96]